MPEKIALWFLFFAYTAVFLILFLFVGRAHRRTAEMEKNLRRVEESIGPDDGEEGDGP